MLSVKEKRVRLQKQPATRLTDYLFALYSRALSPSIADPSLPVAVIVVGSRAIAALRRVHFLRIIEGDTSNYRLRGRVSVNYQEIQRQHRIV